MCMPGVSRRRNSWVQSRTSKKSPQCRACYFGCLKDLTGSFEGDIDIDVQVDVCVKSVSKSVQVLVHGIEAVMVQTLTILKCRACAVDLLAPSSGRRVLETEPQHQGTQPPGARFRPGAPKIAVQPPGIAFQSLGVSKARL